MLEQLNQFDNLPLLVLQESQSEQSCILGIKCLKAVHQCKHN